MKNYKMIVNSEDIPNTEVAYYANEFYKSVMGI